MDLREEISVNICISWFGVEYLFGGHSEIIARYSLIHSYYLICIKYSLVLSTYIIYSLSVLLITDITLYTLYLPISLLILHYIFYILSFSLLIWLPRILGITRFTPAKSHRNEVYCRTWDSSHAVWEGQRVLLGCVAAWSRPHGVMAPETIPLLSPWLRIRESAQLLLESRYSVIGHCCLKSTLDATLLKKIRFCAVLGQNHLCICQIRKV